MKQTFARPENGRPLQNLPPMGQDAFVEADPSSVFRVGSRSFVVKLSDYYFLATARKSVETAIRIH
jgi:hypothetical protein